MRLSRAADYAMRCVYYLSCAEQDAWCSRHEVAEKMGIPAQFLTKIAQRLCRAGLVEIRRGAKGGLRLIVAPKDITMLDVIEAISGPIVLNACLAGRGGCPHSGTCPMHPVWLRAATALRTSLSEETFADLVASGR